MAYCELSKATKKIQDLSEKNNAWVVQSGENYFLGYDGFLKCMEYSHFFWWVAFVGNFPFLKFL